MSIQSQTKTQFVNEKNILEKCQDCTGTEFVQAAHPEFVVCVRCGKYQQRQTIPRTKAEMLAEMMEFSRRHGE